MGANESHDAYGWGGSDSSDAWIESDVSCDGSYSSDEADNPCCTPNEVASNVGHISQLTSFMRGLFVTKEIQDAMRAVCRSHFVYNTGAEIRSLFYNRERGDDQHICFTPRREVNIDTVIVQFLENLQLQPGHHFLNLGSGTGYLSTLAGLIIGASGINHGMELNPEMLAYCEERQKSLRDHVDSLQEFDYCEPQFVLGDALKVCTVDSILTYYDCIFCSCIPPTGYENALKLHLRDGGRLMYPESGGMCVVIEKHGTEYERRGVDVFSAVYTYPLTAHECEQSTQLLNHNFPTLQQLSRCAIRAQVRKAMHIHAMKKRKSDDESSPRHNKKRKNSKNSSASETIDNVSVSENNSCHEIDFRTIQNYDFRNRTAHSSTVTELNSMAEPGPDRQDTNEDVTAPDNSEVIIENGIAEPESSTSSTEELTQQNPLVAIAPILNQIFDPLHVGLPAGESSDDSSGNGEDNGEENSLNSGYSTDDDDNLEDDGMFAPEQEYCTACHMVKGKSIPRKVVQHEPNRKYPTDSLNARLTLLPLPDNIVLYLKYKHDLETV